MYQQIDANRRKSYLLVALIIGLVSAAGYVYGQYSGYGSSAVWIPLLISAGGSLISWFFGDSIALAATHAKQIESKEQAPELWNLLENLSITAGIPMPKLYVIHDEAPNAFATGRNPEHASVAVTTGLAERLTRSELEGVLAHELSHIQNEDTRWMVLVGVLVGSLSLMGDWFFHVGGRSSSDDDRRSGGVQMIVGIAFLILAPIIGQLIQLAISRKREFLADASAALLTRYPDALASALEKIATNDKPVTHAPQALSHLWISSPAADHKPSLMERWFSTHPPITERVAELRRMSHPTRAN